MILVDNSGNTFSAFNEPEDLWQAQDCPYVLWFEPDRLSVNMKYCMPLRILAPAECVEFTAELDSSASFTFIPPQAFLSGTEIQTELKGIWGSAWDNWFQTDVYESIKDGYAVIEESETRIVDPLNPDYIWWQVTNSDKFTYKDNTLVINNNPYPDIPFFIEKLTLRHQPDKPQTYYWAYRMSNGNSEYILYTFYVLGFNEDEETVLKNVRLEGRNASGEVVESAVVRIGGTFYDDSEELVIHAANKGVRLPADICKAFWNCGFNEYYPDKVEHRNKLKELLFNYMGIRGECGNYNSAEQSLKWFGWGDKIELSQLVLLNRNLANCYLNDYFDVFTDIPSGFDTFRRTTYMSLKVHLQNIHGLGEPASRPPEGSESSTTESDESPNHSEEYEDAPRWRRNEKIFGENERYIKYRLDLDERLNEYNYVMNELGMKLACLASLYETYFLPVHLNIMSASTVEHVSSAPLKMLCGTAQSSGITMDCVSPSDVRVEFPQLRYVINTERYGSYAVIRLRFAGTGICAAYGIITDDGSEVIYRFDTGADLSESGEVRIRIDVDSLKTDITTASHIAVWCGGRWFEENISFVLPEINIQAGTLEYVYVNQDPVSDTSGNPCIGEPDLALSRIAELYEKESESDDPVSKESRGLVAGIQKLNLNIPSVRKNLVFTEGLYNIIDELYRFDSKLLDTLDWNESDFFPGTENGELRDSFRQILETSGFGLQEVSGGLGFAYDPRTAGSLVFEYGLRADTEMHVKVSVPDVSDDAYTSSPVIAQIYASFGLDSVVTVTDQDENILYINYGEVTGSGAGFRAVAVQVEFPKRITELTIDIHGSSVLYGVEFISPELMQWEKVKTLKNFGNPFLLAESSMQSELEIVSGKYRSPEYAACFSCDFKVVEQILSQASGSGESSAGVPGPADDMQIVFKLTLLSGNDTVSSQFVTLYRTGIENMLYEVPVTLADAPSLKAVISEIQPGYAPEGSEVVEPELTPSVRKKLLNSIKAVIVKPRRGSVPGRVPAENFGMFVDGLDVSGQFDAFIMENIYFDYARLLSKIAEASDEELPALLRNVPGVYYKHNIPMYFRTYNSGACDAESFRKRFMPDIEDELRRLRRSGNAGVKLYITAISKQPLNKFFENPEDYPKLGISSFRESKITEWLRISSTLTFRLDSGYLLKDVPTKRNLRFLWNRQKFFPCAENGGFAENSFCKDDIVAVRITNKYTDTAFWGFTGETPETYSVELSKYGRFEFVPSSAGMSKGLESMTVSNYAVLERTSPNSVYLQPGYYDILFRYSINSFVGNISKLAESAVRVKNTVSSSLYYDLYET